MNRYVPGPGALNELEVAVVPATFSEFVEVNSTAPVHVASAGPNTSNRTIPVGAAEPAGTGPKVAVSEIIPPAAADAAVTIGIGAGVTAAASPGSLHRVASGW
jgi:hypothetical protein